MRTFFLHGKGSIQLLYIGLQFIVYGGTLKLTSSTFPVYSLAGSDVELTCTFSSSLTPQLTDIAVEWKADTRDGQMMVYSFDGKKEVYNRNGSEVSQRRLVLGDASLHLRNVTVGDEGLYTCTVLITPEMGFGTTQLDVSVQPSVTLLPELPTITVGEERTLLCEINRFYPKPIDVVWFIKKDFNPEQEAVSRDVCTGIPLPNGDETFSVQSRITLWATAKESDVVYTCQVRHKSYKTAFRTNTTLTVIEPEPAYRSPTVIAGTAAASILVTVAVLGAVFIHFKYLQKVPPKVSEILVPEMIFGNETVTLICNISAFRPKQVQVKWLRLSHNQSRQEKEHCSSSERIPLQEADEDLSDMAVNKPLKHGRLYSTVSCLRIVPTLDDDNREYRCRVQHGKSKPIIKSTTLRVKVRPSYCQITSLPHVPEPGKQLVLCCRTEQFYPRAITLKWFRDELLVEQFTQFGPFQDSGGLYSVWNQIELTVSKNDHKVVYTCRVYHESFTGFKELSYRINLQGMPPEVLWITSDPAQPEVGKECTLNCHMNNFCPDTITVKWLKNNLPLDNGVSSSPSILDTNGRYSLYSFLKLTPKREDQGSVIKCIVEHSALTSCEERSYRLHLVN
ncbi:hypothetical protein AOXY_G36954 [Acipenser oxyrinchus oxyrinchus]|uniref:Ig-like domain-containing protein n=1 Tax=Acipenser oxyrinchus oxyrinchus TaxID=40147 RepID=A0AAD8FN08_ACIOX|nr:hypothetical protein AOXY_G36954 [Acipenser oxyrinchus oxyrinchus]